METPRFRWTAEFLAGPGGFASKEEISSDWFNSKAEAVNDANKNADNEVQEFPYARNILRLVVVDETGKQMVELRGRSREHWRFSPLNISIVDDVEPVACSTMVCSHDILFLFSLVEWLEDYVFWTLFYSFCIELYSRTSVWKRRIQTVHFESFQTRNSIFDDLNILLPLCYFLFIVYRNYVFSYAQKCSQCILGNILPNKLILIANSSECIQDGFRFFYTKWDRIALYVLCR